MVCGRATEVADRATALRAALGRGVTVGISGVDCAGKSTLAEAVRGRLAERDVPAVLVAGDELTRPSAERHAEIDRSSATTGTVSTTTRCPTSSCRPSAAPSQGRSRCGSPTGSETRGPTE